MRPPVEWVRPGIMYRWPRWMMGDFIYESARRHMRWQLWVDMDTGQYRHRRIV